MGISFRGTESICKWSLKWLNQVSPRPKGRKNVNVNKVPACKFLYQWNCQGVRARTFYNKLIKIPLAFKLSRKWCL